MQEIEFLEQNKKTSPILKKTYFIGLLLFILYFISCFIASCCTKKYCYFYSSILCCFTGVLSISLMELNGNLVVSLSKNKSLKSGLKYFIFILVNFFRYFVILIPLLTILIIKNCNGNANIFELYSTLVGTLISPCYIIISQVVLLTINKKNAK